MTVIQVTARSLTCSFTSTTTLFHSFRSKESAEQAATNQQLPTAPWLRSLGSNPSTTSFGLEHIS